ncbi:MAG: DUF2304 domain-containing protein [[Bacteroides] pectinophilus]|nr:DUF2304 domain-containing protein [[Bacteroides] pectinophilus]
MMTLKFRLIMAAILLIGFVIIINMVRKKSLDLRYALIWLALIAMILVIVIVPGLLGVITHFLGIYDAMNMVFFMGFVFLIVVTFFLTAALSRNSNRIKALTQQVALLEKQVRDESVKVSVKDEASSEDAERRL